MVPLAYGAAGDMPRDTTIPALLQAAAALV
jgi:hypothetical protein